MSLFRSRVGRGGGGGGGGQGIKEGGRDKNGNFTVGRRAHKLKKPTGQTNALKNVQKTSFLPSSSMLIAATLMTKVCPPNAAAAASAAAKAAAAAAAAASRVLLRPSAPPMSDLRWKEGMAKSLFLLLFDFCAF